jgi:integrase
LFGYLVGWRKGEIASLAWADVDGDVIRLRAENSKNGDGRLIVLEGELATLIERRKAARQTRTAESVKTLDSLIFHRNGLPIGDIRKAWGTACKLTGIRRLFHDLRRTAVRNMIRAGVGEKVAMEVSGHKTQSMLDRYNIVSETDLRLAMRRTQDYLKAHVEEARIITMPATVQ